MISLGVGLYRAGPAGNGGDADAALVEFALHAPERTIGIEALGVVPGLVVMAVVRREHDQCVLGDAQVPEQIEQMPHVTIHARDHGGLALVRIGPVLVRIGAVVGDLGPVATADENGAFRFETLPPGRYRVRRAVGKGMPILLVEDDLSILKLTERILVELDYTVLTADSPKRALKQAKEHNSEIHLLVTDVIMPEMNGLEMANRLQSLYPSLKRIFMSGYTGRP